MGYAHGMRGNHRIGDPLLLSFRGWALVAAIALGTQARADTTPLVVAVAANFKEVQDEIAASFTERTGVPVESVGGSTGKLYAQICNGSPFHVFLAADEEHPRRLESEGLAVPATRTTYALGRLALMSSRPDIEPDEATLRGDAYRHLAIANPDLAPYGLAARQALQRLGIWDAVRSRVVLGESIGQAYQFVHTGNAELALVAYAQVSRDSDARYWLVPAELHDPIRQQAVVLNTETPHPSARAYVEFLLSPEAVAIMKSAGYARETAFTGPVEHAPVHGFDWRPIGVTLRLAFVTTTLLLLVGTPLAWWLARGPQSWVRSAIEALVALPLVLPPTVLGFYLLVLLGPDGPVGRPWEALGGPRLVFSFPGLVIGSMLFSLPFVVQPLQNAFIGVGTRPLEVAAMLRAGPMDRFFTVALPLSRQGILTAATLGFAHTLGEFGVVLMIGGSIPGRTQVISIAIYDRVESLEYAQAHLLSAGMLALSFAVLLAMIRVHRRAPMRLS